MTLEQIMPWLGFVALLITLGQFFTSPGKALATIVAALDARVVKLEGDVKHLPNTESIHRQQLDISEMKGEMGIIKKSIEATERTTRRVEDFLMERNGHG